jgi:hypothetical protein
MVRMRRHKSLLSKHLRVSWGTARTMLRKIRQAMAHRDSIYRLASLIELDDTVAGAGGKRSAKEVNPPEEAHVWRIHQSRLLSFVHSHF